MVLYRAISSYQLLEVLLHRRKYHPCESAILILPDFIVGKYPQYKKLVSGHFFTKVILFPYLHIPHLDERTILERVSFYFEKKVPFCLDEFTDIYIAGAHFYFTLYVLKENISFTFFEDAAGMLGKAEMLYENLKNRFPVHAEIAKKYGLFDGSNPLIKKIVCMKKAQNMVVSDEKYENFDVSMELQNLNEKERNRIIRFFLRRKIYAHADAIVLTQNFSGLGIMDGNRQKALYLHMKKNIPSKTKLLIKPHPDDHFDYRMIFPNAIVLKKPFPSELLPYVFHKKPAVVYSFDSAGCENLTEDFIVKKIAR